MNEEISRGIVIAVMAYVCLPTSAYLLRVMADSAFCKTPLSAALGREKSPSAELPWHFISICIFYCTF